MLKVGQRVRWTSIDGTPIEGTVIAADKYGTETTQDSPPADVTWHHGPNATLEVVD
jgi:hypothetical protein